ncbi:MAG: flagellar basal-body rod protein FlgF [Sphingomonas sp.]|jgi:flagellar hook protein FlgE|uniref:flagellar basal-body rod protein FlgF n=1 Tax=Sphingomonas sp. TaxID=28214 RepID=UPI00356B0F7B
MFGSIYIGLSGLNAYSRGLKQVSNNVANLNSQGFKSSTVSFTDLFGARQNGGLSYSAGQGSSGHGVRMGDTVFDMSSGELRQTDRDLDLSIDGSGFLMLMRGGEVAYTRTGSFEVDKDGYIVLSGSDYRLATLDSAGRPVSLSIDQLGTNPPKATTKIVLANNLSADSTVPQLVSNIKVVDLDGGQHVWQAKFERVANSTGQWTATVTDEKGVQVGGSPKTFTIINGRIDPATSVLDFTTSGWTVSFDMAGIGSYAGGNTSTLSAASVDGYAVGTITSLSVNKDGELEIGYSNAQKKQLGAVAVADFRDPQALEQRSGGLFSDSGGAGRQLLASTDPRVGLVKSRTLEASNVDLSREFGDLILIQRGFQASSQIISVTNDMIQQLFGIRGQG